MMITYGRCAIAGCALLIAAQGAVAASPAKEGSFEGMTCYAGPQHVITDGKGTVGASYDVVGTPMRKEDDLLYHASTHCVGSVTIVGAESTERGMCVQMAPDGDRFFVVYSRHNQEPGTWKAIAGIGKFEGMEASGTWAIAIMPVKPARADIIQSCNKETGHWKLK